jgi:hypothetical protein
VQRGAVSATGKVVEGKGKEVILEPVSVLTRGDHEVTFGS